MEQFKQYLQELGYTDRSIIGHIQAAKQFNTWLDAELLKAENLNYNDLLEYIATLKQRGIAIGTQKRILNTLRHFFRFLIHQNKRDTNPALHLQVKGKSQSSIHNHLPKAELDNIYQTFEKSDFTWHKKKNSDQAHLRQTVILSLLIYQGLLQGEIQKLLVTDFQIFDGTLTVPESDKLNRRILKLEIKQVFALQEYFKQIKGEKLMRVRVKDQLTVVFKKLRRNGIVTGTNIIRKSFIVNSIQEHGLLKASYLAGHRYISSTEPYNIEMLEGLKRDVERFCPV